MIRGIFSGAIWGIISKIIDAIAKFITVPILIGFYGKSDYGLIALTFSLNAYLRLMDIGMNTGSIRYFSMWITQREWDKIKDVSRSSMVFYGVIGLINALIFVWLGQYGSGFFNVRNDQIDVYRMMMFALAASSVFNWTSNVINQLLTAYNEISWLSKVSVISSGLNLLTAYLAVKLGWSIAIYFLIYIVSTLIVIPLNVYKLRVYMFPLKDLLCPKWNGNAFNEILSYSLGIFSMGLFQFSADSLRPIILSRYASNGIEVLTEYRVIQTITTLVVAFGGVFMQVLLPSVSKLYADDRKESMEKLVFKGTKYISVFISFIVFLLVTNAHDLLILYMGTGYSNLTIWLIVWLITLLSLHNTPISSLILSSGNTKFLVYTSAISCVVSLPLTALLADELNVGAAVVGYCVYILMQLSFYYLHYVPKVLKLNSSVILFRCFLPSVVIGASSWTVTDVLVNLINIELGVKALIANSLIYCSLYLFLMVAFVLKRNELIELKNRLIGSK